MLMKSGNLLSIESLPDAEVSDRSLKKALNNMGAHSYSVWAQNISAAYNGGPYVLKNINLQLPSGQLIVIVGPNGAGKSTLFNLLIGLKVPARGKLLVFGKSIKHQCNKQYIAYVPQHEQIDWDYPISVWDVVLAGRYGHMKRSHGLRGFLPPSLAEKKHFAYVKSALCAVDMWSYRKCPIGALSGGQKKRVFIARALAQDARLMLLDEPLVGVDERSEKLIFNTLIEAKNTGKTVIMITHDLNSVKHYANYIVLINGTVIASGYSVDILKKEKISHDNTSIWEFKRKSFDDDKENIKPSHPGNTGGRLYGN